MSNLSFKFLEKYYPVFIEGIQWTLLVAMLSVILGAILGTLLCFMKRSKLSILKVPIPKVIASVYIELIYKRNTTTTTNFPSIFWYNLLRT